LAKVEGF